MDPDPDVLPKFQPEVAVPAGQVIPFPKVAVVYGFMETVPEVSTFVENPLFQSPTVI